MLPRSLVWLLLVSGLGFPAARAHAGVALDGVFTATNDLSGAYRLVVPDGAAGPDALGLLLFFHADGDVNGFRTHADQLAARGEKSRLAVAALRVPREGGGDGTPPTEPGDQCWWAPRVESNAQYVDEWIQGVALPELGASLDSGRIYFAGVSGGADFAAALNLQLGFRYQGGAVAVCGGDLPRRNGGSCIDEPEPPLLEPLPAVTDVPAGATRGFVYSFDLTADDPLRPLARDASDYYRGLGFAVRFGVPRGSGHCGFDASLEAILDRRIAWVANVVAPRGCSRIEVAQFAEALVDDVPLEVADQAIPAVDPGRETLLAEIQAELGAIEGLRATIPDAVDLCSPRSECAELGLRATARQIRRHLSRLKRRLVPAALARSADPELRSSLRALNRSSHRTKKAALREIPADARLCEP